MPLLENLATAAMTVIAASLTVLSLLAWRHSRSRKVLFLSVGFGLFFIKGLALSAGLFLSVDWGERLLPPSVILDLVILLVFYAAVLQRPGS